MRLSLTHSLSVEREHFDNTVYVSTLSIGESDKFNSNFLFDVRTSFVRQKRVSLLRAFFLQYFFWKRKRKQQKYKKLKLVKIYTKEEKILTKWQNCVVETKEIKFLCKIFGLRGFKAFC